jgi:hypothetical protein
MLKLVSQREASPRRLVIAVNGDMPTAAAVFTRERSPPKTAADGAG